MKTSLRDSLLIATALFTILGCGFGLGRLSPQDPAPLAPTVPADSLEDEVLSSLRQSLDLSEDQEKAIAPALDRLSSGVLDSRQKALLQYYRSLLSFHTEIAPELSPRQQKLLEANRKLLEDELHTRFPSLQ